MALTVPYSITLARRLAERDLHFTWMEEFLPPDAYDGYEETDVHLGSPVKSRQGVVESGVTRGEIGGV